MKITIAGYTLFDGELESPEACRLRSEDNLQIAEGIRAEDIQAFNRGNTRYIMTMVAKRTHADFMDAEIFLLTHKAGIPTSGCIALYCEDATGAKTKYLWQNATLHVADGEYIGCSTIWNYTITGGAIVLATSS
jgi:hypothetical protein